MKKYLPGNEHLLESGIDDKMSKEQRKHMESEKVKTFLKLITMEMEEAFRAAGYDEAYAKVSLSNRPDLCEYQCNGALAAAKAYKKAPIMKIGRAHV